MWMVVDMIVCMSCVWAWGRKWLLWKLLLWPCDVCTIVCWYYVDGMGCLPLTTCIVTSPFRLRWVSLLFRILHLTHIRYVNIYNSKSEQSTNWISTNAERGGLQRAVTLSNYVNGNQHQCRQNTEKTRQELAFWSSSSSAAVSFWARRWYILFETFNVWLYIQHSTLGNAFTLFRYFYSWQKGNLESSISMSLIC